MPKDKGKKAATARKPRSQRKPAAAEAPSTAPESGTTLFMPPTSTVKSLASEKRKTKKRISEISGEHGSSVKEAADKKHLDKTAFSIVTRLDALSDNKLARTYFHLLRYMDDLGVPERAKAQSDMFEEGDEAEEAPGSEQKGLRVVAGGAAEAREVDESAGLAAAANG